MKENRMLPIGTETFRIFVDEAEDGVIRGRVSGGTLPEETLFRSLSRLILLLEEQLDTGGAPKANVRKHPRLNWTSCSARITAGRGDCGGQKAAKRPRSAVCWSCSSKWKRFWHSNTHQFRNPYLL